MLYDTACRWKDTLDVDGVWVGFSFAKEGTKVSMHAFDALLGLIT